MALDFNFVELFEEHFANGFGSTFASCECGKTFVCKDMHGEDEIKDCKNAVMVDFSSRQIEFEGSFYLDLCNCWHDRANKIGRFLVSHHGQIVSLLNDVKKIQQSRLDDIPDGGP